MKKSCLDFARPSQIKQEPVEQTISRNLGSLGPREAIHANTLQNHYLAKNPEAIYGRVLQEPALKSRDCGLSFVHKFD